ncbi:Appr-1-p processing protein [Bacillus cereus]|uniref:Appr-1-p processing protein n=2 Tax=Bacillus cereus group TaxID=86661 RepID=A0A9X6ZQB6_BACTU|nr:MULTISPECIES: macro domain-containing protein [Bacillus cereus group]PDZ94760.1 Appr-1-p processing protein [Bacillus cereus]PFJ31835.1 Appr-1-p processing protein [Bacillus thuringiensis]
MLTIILGDITKAKKVDYICNAANGIGPMIAGVAGAIKKAGGRTIELEAVKTCLLQNPKSGDVYVTKAGELPYKNIVHLVTMKLPGMPSNYKTIEKCLTSLVTYCRQNDISKIALPGLGTGVGKLDKKKVSNIYKQILEPVEDIDFVVYGMDEEFIHSFFRENE